MNVYYESRTLPLYYECQQVLTSMPHMHKEIEIVYFEKGSCEVVADGFHAVADEGDFFISFPNQIHYYKNCPLGRYHVAIVSTDVIMGLGSVFFKRSPISNIYSPAADSLARRYAEAALSVTGEQAYTKQCGLINLIVGELMEGLELRPVKQVDGTAVRDVLDYCNLNFSSELTLSGVADALHLNKYYVSHLINDRIGLRFCEYVNALRINRACQILKDGEIKIADLSEEVGFGSIRSFNRAFKEQVGMTPYEFKRQYHQSDFK